MSELLDGFVEWWEEQVGDSHEWTTLERLAARDAWIASRRAEFDYEAAMEWARQAAGQKWVSVEERLPEEPRHYDVTIEDCDGHRDVDTYYFSSKSTFCGPYKVTHWKKRPLPQPPEEEPHGPE
jgi:hypothetical protein